MKEQCRETLRQAYLILDGEDVEDERRTQIETHLHECGPCYERYGVEREVKFVIARLKGCTTCPDELRARIRHLLDFD